MKNNKCAHLRIGYQTNTHSLTYRFIQERTCAYMRTVAKFNEISFIYFYFYKFVCDVVRIGVCRQIYHLQQN